MKKALKIVLLLVIMASLLLSCGRSARVIPVRKMERIYREMLLADQWLAKNPDKRNMADTTWFYEPIFERYGYTLKDYQKSVDRYLNDPKRYAEMVARVEKDLRKELWNLNAKISQEDKLRHLADSVYNARKNSATRVFNSFLDAFDTDFRIDTIHFEKDTLGVYVPVPVIEDTVVQGPALTVRDTTPNRVQKEPFRKLNLIKLQEDLVVE
ncbi:MAG TPA: hypothetical protein DD383_03965 [Rikenellaceae bacterium]|nr:hypothetical protein [Rikenellaceae bacterium]HCQ72703.1 hypothetical protein [Rikenellaceae bacterium]